MHKLISIYIYILICSFHKFIFLTSNVILNSGIILIIFKYYTKKKKKFIRFYNLFYAYYSITMF